MKVHGLLFKCRFTGLITRGTDLESQGSHSSAFSAAPQEIIHASGALTEEKDLSLQYGD
jgi:hypothetical protein